MNSHISAILTRALSRIFAPLVRMLLRNGIPYSAAADILKRVYIDQASQHFPLPHKKMTTARISILTGINRHDIAKLADTELLNEAQHDSRSGRIIRMWIRNPEYLDSKGQPITLPLEGDISLMALIKKCAGDIPPKAMLEELLSSNSILQDDTDQYTLTSGAFIPSDNFTTQLDIAAKAIHELLSTIENNTQFSAEQAQFQRTLRYKQVPVEALPALRQWQQFHGQLTLEHADAAYAEIIRQTRQRTDCSGKQYRVGIGLYHFEIANPEEP